MSFSKIHYIYFYVNDFHWLWILWDTLSDWRDWKAGTQQMKKRTLNVIYLYFLMFMVTRNRLNSVKFLENLWLLKWLLDAISFSILMCEILIGKTQNWKASQCQSWLGFIYQAFCEISIQDSYVFEGLLPSMPSCLIPIVMPWGRILSLLSGWINRLKKKLSNLCEFTGVSSGSNK